MNTPPKWFRVIAVVALLWNLLGCFAFFSDLRLSPQDLAQLSQAQQALYNARPGWAAASTALAVFGGALGCIGLLLRKSWALPLFIISLGGIFVQDYALFILAHGVSLAGPAAVVLQGLVLVIAIGLILLSRRALARGWLQ
jgi:hypothetical protein